MTDLRWVPQEESWGCGCAAVAMLTGKTYAEVKAHVERDFDGAYSGMDSGSWQSVLAELGYATASIHRVRQYPWQNCARDIWPPKPWAEIHLCEVVVAGGSGGSHMVVMQADGSVLDPLTSEPKRLTDYAQCFMVAAVVPSPPIPQSLRVVHRQPEMEFSRSDSRLTNPDVA